MKMFWIKFESISNPSVFNLGVGVTAISIEDALLVLKAEESLPRTESINSIVRVRSLEELDKNHVLPNIGNYGIRGVWFPA
jgi:hypothetical protein